MRTLHLGLRVADPDRAVAFYTAVGYEVVGRVPETASGQLTMLKLPADDVVSVELVFDPTEAGRHRGTGLSHFVIQEESMEATITDLRAKGIEVAEPESPDGSADFLTPGSRTPTATGSSWSSGPPAMPTA